MAATSYATTADMQTYIGVGSSLDLNADNNSTFLTTLLSIVSRFIDGKCGQFFYNDGVYTRNFDSQGMSHVDTGQHPFFGSSGTIASSAQGATSLTYTAGALSPRVPVNGDKLTLDTGSLKEQVTINGAVTGTGPYTVPVTATSFAHATSTLATTFSIQLAYFENQPIAQWVATLDGDGINPPSNFFLWPRNRPRVGSTADQTAFRPWYGADISHIPISNTTFLPSSIPGYVTVKLTANWGWPTVPDVVKHITCEVTARAWADRRTGWTGLAGSADTGMFRISKYWTDFDRAALEESGLMARYF